MTAEQGIFAVAGALSLLGAANAVLRRDPLPAALSLTLTLFSLAVLYLGLGAPFLAGVQIAVYAGAIMVLLVFVVMLLGAGQVAPPRIGRPPLAAAAVLVSLALFALLATVVLRGELPSAVGARPAEGDHVAALGLLLFGRYLLAFEVTSVLLLAALIAAVVLARKRSTDREWPS
jgi:NADH-quinone oxidoreductase subunit J